MLGHPLDFIASLGGQLDELKASAGGVAQAAPLASELIVSGRAGKSPFRLEVKPAAGRFLESYRVQTAKECYRLEYGAAQSADARLTLEVEGGSAVTLDHMPQDADIVGMNVAQGFANQITHLLRLAAGEDDKPVCTLMDACHAWEAISHATRAL